MSTASNGSPYPTRSSTRSESTGGSMSLAQSAQASRSGAKRRRDEDGNETESDNDEQSDPKTRPLTEAEDRALTNLTNHSSRFDFTTDKMEVKTLLQWHHTNTACSSQLIFDKKYQRDQNVGWDAEKKSQYLKTVMAGQAATPFVANVGRGTARLMDGGHRLQALVAFCKGEIQMQINGSQVYYTQLKEEDQEHFNSRKLQVMQFRNLPFKDEVEFFIQLNSGLPLSYGERLHATTSCNPVTKLADYVVKDGTAQGDVEALCKHLRKGLTDGDEGRKNELLALSFFVFNMIFRPREDPVKLTIADTFLLDMCKLNEEAEWKDTRQHNGKTLVQHKDNVMGLLKRTLDLFNAVNRPEGQTPFRCVVFCMLAVREMEEAGSAEDGVRGEVMSRLMANPGDERLRKIFTGKIRVLQVKDIKRFVRAYTSLALQPSVLPPPPPPPPHVGPLPAAVGA